MFRRARRCLGALARREFHRIRGIERRPTGHHLIDHHTGGIQIGAGGERSIRGYEVYTIGPRTEQGVNMGGVKSFFLNLEYIIPIGGPVYAILFYDMGNSLLGGQHFSRHDLYTSSGVEARIFVPALRVPFRLIFAYNNRPIYLNQQNFAFRFAVGTTF